MWAVGAVSVLAVGTVIGVTLWQLHLPLLLQGTTPTGGDNGGHFAMPGVLSQLLFSHGRLTGWDPSWYDGYPIYTFYFVVPDLIAALGAKVVGAAVAFKWATVLGSLLLPLAAWACGRLFRLRPPAPALLAVLTLPMLFDSTWTIDGSNLFSTLAGEYAFSYSLALAVLFLGLFARGIRTGRHRPLAAVVLAGCILCHIVPAMLALVGALFLTLAELVPARLRPLDSFTASRLGTGGGPLECLAARRAMWWGTTTVVAGVALSGWWLVPFGLRESYTTDMGYLKVTDYGHLLFPAADVWAVVLAAGAALAAIGLRSRFGLLLAALAGASAAGVVFDPQGSLWNERLLPLWFMCVYLLVGWGFAELAGLVGRLWRRDRQARWALVARRSLQSGRPAGRRPWTPPWAPGAVGGGLVGVVAVAAIVVAPFTVSEGVLSGVGVHAGSNQVTNWAAWNYSGYQAKPAYPEFSGLMATMGSVGRRYGCGRAMWEYSPDLNRFGTTMAPMLLPDMTGGCIDSMEGLLFESSTTTPYHFLNQAELSVSPSEAVSNLPYGPVDVALGVRHLQLLGVRYLMLTSSTTQEQAATDPSLRLIASSGPWESSYNGAPLRTTWRIYLVKGSGIVTPLTHEPAVLRGVAPAQSSWLGPSDAWYLHPGRWGVELAAGGPAAWPRVSTDDRHPPAVRVATTTVTHVQPGITAPDQPISFDVSRTGVPVLVKVSYFPNWQAHGARGPWRVTPNLMVVVPTRHHVTLVYGTTGVNEAGMALSAAGVVGLVAPAAWRRRRHRVGGRAPGRPGAQRRHQARHAAARVGIWRTGGSFTRRGARRPGP